MHRVSLKFVPRLLTQDQRDSRIAICQELLDRASEDENFPKRTRKGDETWVYGYDELRGFSPKANYTDQETAACQRS
jgi:hypothetical protein